MVLRLTCLIGLHTWLLTDFNTFFSGAKFIYEDIDHFYNYTVYEYLLHMNKSDPEDIDGSLTRYLTLLQFEPERCFANILSSFNVQQRCKAGQQRN